MTLQPFDTCRRRGISTLAVLASLIVALSILATGIQTLSLELRDVHETLDVRQANLILDAAIDRASQKIDQEGTYEGEVWEITIDESQSAATSTIKVVRLSGAEGTETLSIFATTQLRVSSRPNSRIQVSRETEYLSHSLTNSETTK